MRSYISKYFQWSFLVCLGLRNRFPWMYFALQVIASMAKNDEGRLGKRNGTL